MKPVKNDKFALPDWIPSDIWQHYVDHRIKLKSAMTGYAKVLVVAKLDKFRAEGHEPVDVINLNIESGWKSLIKPKNKPIPIRSTHNETPMPRKTREGKAISFKEVAKRLSDEAKERKGRK